MREENYIPDEEDVDVEAAAMIAVGDSHLSVLAQRPKDVRAKLERALKSGAGSEVIRAIRSEYRELVAIRLEMATDLAVDTLETIMENRWANDKTSTAAAKSAEMVLDRAGFPKVSRRFVTNEGGESRDIMPPLPELLADANSQEAKAITENYLEAVRLLDAMRHKTKQVIDVRPGKPDESTG